MKTAWAALAAIAILSASPAVAKKPGRGNGNENGNGHGKHGGEVSYSFSSGEVRAIHEYYGAHPQSLPPGLQKKLARGGTLPPGWQKKIAPFPVELERRMAPLECGECRRGLIDGHAVVYSPRTMVVIDVVFGR